MRRRWGAWWRALWVGVLVAIGMNALPTWPGPYWAYRWTSFGEPCYWLVLWPFQFTERVGEPMSASELSRAYEATWHRMEDPNAQLAYRDPYIDQDLPAGAFYWHAGEGRIIEFRASGLLANAGIACVLVVVWRLVRWRLGRRPAGHCRACGYDLTGNVSGRCPECGTAVPAGTGAVGTVSGKG